MATLVPQFSGHDPYNFGIAETYSYIPIANDVNRPIYAKASYITNFEDLAVSLSTGDINIGSVHILDNTNGLTVSIANVGLGGLDSNKGAMRVLTQDFESTVDSIALGDVNGNPVIVNAATSALNVFTVNGISAVSITNQLTGITVLNPVTAVGVFSLGTYVNLITANQVTEITLQKTLTANNATSVNQLVTNTLLNSLTANVATAANQATTNTLLNSLTANVATAANQVSTNTLLNSVTANQATSVNQVATNTLLNSVTANQGIEITLQKALTANNATQANQIVTNTLLNSVTANQANQITLSNSLTSLANNIDTVLFSVTANQATQITLEKTLSANSVYGTLSSQPLFTTVTNPVTSILVSTNSNTLAVSGAVTITNNLSGNVGVSMASNWGITIVGVTSSAYVQFPSNVAHVASLMNTTGGILYVGKWNSSSTVGLPLLNNSSIEINLTGNTNEIGVKSTLGGTVSAYAMYTDWNS